MTTQDLIDVAKQAIQGTGDNAADFVRGSDYESFAGTTAVIYTREGRRDADLFGATKFHTAQGDDLTNLVKQRYGVDRYLDTRGTGTASLIRPSAAAGAGTIWTGTRILIIGGEPKYYRATADVPVGALATSASVPIEAVDIGPGSMVNQTTDLRVDDLLWDSTWTCASLVCSDGTKFEPASALIARVRQGRHDARVGQRKLIETVCKAAGADKVAPFEADNGLNVCYVGDAGYSSSPAMVKACTLALRNARVAGDHLQVLQMASTPLAVSVDVYLWDIPQTINLQRLELIHRAAILQVLGGKTGGFTFSTSAISGAIIRNTPEVQDVKLVTPAADVGILVGGVFPAVLNRYIVSDVAIRYHGPA